MSGSGFRYYGYQTVNERQSEVTSSINFHGDLFVFFVFFKIEIKATIRQLAGNAASRL